MEIPSQFEMGKYNEFSGADSKQKIRENQAH
jgi:hypothetical protein